MDEGGLCHDRKRREKKRSFDKKFEKNDDTDPGKKPRIEGRIDAVDNDTNDSWIWTGGGTRSNMPGERLGKGGNYKFRNVGLKKGEREFGGDFNAPHQSEPVPIGKKITNIMKTKPARRDDLPWESSGNFRC